MRGLNAAGITFAIKGTDDYGPIFEALITHPGNIGVYRLTEEEHGSKGVRNTPDYTASPLYAAVKHCLSIIRVIESETPEFDKTRVYVDIINEPRAKKAPGDVQYQDMNAMDWLGEFCYEAALFMAEMGYKVCTPSLNSGEPGESEPHAVIEYSQPGFLKFIRYAAENPNQCLIGLHEYIWDAWKTGETFDDWYPHLWGRFESLIAASDIAGIPRTFKIFMTEWGFGKDDAPTWEQARPHIEAYSQLMARFPQVIGTASWTLQAGWDDDSGQVSDDVQTWIEPLINYTVNELPSTAPQPQTTHALFGSTLPGEPEPPMDILQRIEDLEKIALDHELRLLDIEGVTPPPVDPPLLTIAANALGVDVSAHQGRFDWETAVSNGVTYGICRSSNGLGSASTDSNGRDLQLYNNAEELTRLELPWSIYHYLQPLKISHQIELVHGIIAELNGRNTAPRTATLADGTHLPTLYIDVEETHLLPEQIKAFYDGMIATGLHVGIYTSKSIWDGIMLGTDSWWSNVSCWVAAYGSNSGYPPPWKPWIPYGFDTNVLWQYTSLGGHVVDNPGGGLDLNMATPFEQETEPPIDPPLPDAFDLLPYLRGADGWQLDIDAGTYTQTLNTRHMGDDVWRLVKGDRKQYEYMYADGEYIYRREDTSQGNDKFYCHYTNGIQGAAWVKRHVRVGEKWQTTKEVVHYWNDCSIRQDSAMVVDTIEIVGRYDKWTFENGVSVDDVVELHWVEGGETYLFGLGRGLVGFIDADQGAMFMGDLHGREPLEYNKPPCIDEDERFYA